MLRIKRLIKKGKKRKITQNQAMKAPKINLSFLYVFLNENKLKNQIRNSLNNLEELVLKTLLKIKVDQKLLSVYLSNKLLVLLSKAKKHLI